MRALLTAIALLALGSPALSQPPASSANLLRLHPRAWRFPVPSGASALRSDPEDAAPTAPLRARVAAQAEARARAEANVRLASDGSRHAIVGGALRSWSVASIDDHGQLVTDCVHAPVPAAPAASAPIREPEVKR